MEPVKLEPTEMFELGKWLITEGCSDAGHEYANIKNLIVRRQRQGAKLTDYMGGHSLSLWTTYHFVCEPCTDEVIKSNYQ